MNSPTPTPTPSSSATRRRTSPLKMMFWLLLVPIALVILYFSVVLNWNYSDGERAGWVQKMSRKGWLCKTWEGEMAMVSMPGAIPEKFLFTVRDDAVAETVNKIMGKRVTLHYEQKVGLPTTCFGETRHFVTRVVATGDTPFAPGGVVMPLSPAPTPGAPIAPTTGPSAPATPSTTQPVAPPASSNAPPVAPDPYSTKN